MTVKVAIKQLPHGKDLKLPHYATSHSAGMDLMAAIDKDVILNKGQRTLVPTGIAIALPDGHEAQIRPRSGLAFKNGITVLNTPGTIDADYRGEIAVILINLGDEDFTISRGMRVAQMIIAPYTQAEMDLVEDLDSTVRGKGGFGSTGV
jgi:dUTP pyrophosphatase